MRTVLLVLGVGPAVYVVVISAIALLLYSINPPSEPSQPPLMDLRAARLSGVA